MSLLIKGGRVVTPTEDFTADVYVVNGVIDRMGVALDISADRVIEADGKYILPGAIDPHTHMSMPFGGTLTCDDFTSGTISAAFGGTTTLIDFCIQPPGATITSALAEWHQKLAAAPPVIDVGFHLAVTDLNYPTALRELASLPGEGITSFKLFMAYKNALMASDETLFRTMSVAARSGALVMVHAENGDVIEVLIERALEEGHVSPKYHGLTRPPETEGEATNRAIQLARVANCPLYVVHVSCEEALEPVSDARRRGWNVWAETCTQYLAIDDSMLSRPGFEGAKYVFTPPPRPKKDQAHLWSALNRDTLSVVSSDHCPFNWSTQKSLGRDDFSKIPNGAPGIEHRLQILHTLGVCENLISINRMVELTAANPAKLFGLYPRKGTLAIGSDADIVVFDPKKRSRLSATNHHSRVDYNLFEGLDVTGSPEVVIVRGVVVIEDGEVKAEPGYGKFVARAPFGEGLTQLAP